LNYEDGTTIYTAVTVTVTDANSHSATVALTIVLRNTNDHDPEWATTLDDDITIPEDTAVGTIVSTLAATDGDGDSLTYHVVSQTPDNGKFALSGLDVVTTMTFDYEADPSEQVYTILFTYVLVCMYIYIYIYIYANVYCARC
jgi:hypothetical protein